MSSETARVRAAACRYRALNVQAGCQFCGGGFEGELAAGRLSSSSLDQFSCVALAGVVTEYLRFGQAEGGVGDVAQLDSLLRALQVGAGYRVQGLGRQGLQ
eukprot:GHRQ01034256.1.p1 GENE.GHRQ01034256.1~~GHRQ01034256.1.p1  ORF type:complete len:101 (-),score=25.80 GHRQ01034256.1:362-664(-)